MLSEFLNFMLLRYDAKKINIYFCGDYIQINVE